MKKKIASAALFLLCIGVTYAEASTSKTDQNGGSFPSTKQQRRKCQGTQCPGVNTPHDCGPSNVEITPSPASVFAGQKFTLRFDATDGCNGQGIENFAGSIFWESGGSEALTDSYGFATYIYETGGEHDVTFSMSYRCVDPSGHSDCQSNGTVHIHVAPHR